MNNTKEVSPTYGFYFVVEYRKEEESKAASFTVPTIPTFNTAIDSSGDENTGPEAPGIPGSSTTNPEGSATTDPEGAAIADSDGSSTADSTSTGTTDPGSSTG